MWNVLHTQLNEQDTTTEINRITLNICHILAALDHFVTYLLFPVTGWFSTVKSQNGTAFSNFTFTFALKGALFFGYNFKLFTNVHI